VRITGKKSLEEKTKKEDQIEQVPRAGQGKRYRYQQATHPNKLRKPNISTNTPMVGHLRKTRMIPPRKQTVPR
jgi:hypothetical protein